MKEINWPVTATCVGLVLFIMTFIPGSYVKLARDALDECEKTLPRNQKCVLTAVSKEKK